MTFTDAAPNTAPDVKSRARTLWWLLAVQAGCTLFFLFDVSADLFGWGDQGIGFDDDLVEIVVVAGLVIGVVLVAIELRSLLKRHERTEAQLKVASGAFFELLDQNFADWALTPSERDVALLAIKGLSLAEIADIRNTKQGTIKAQCNAIYQKAGVTGRPQLLSLFIEELMADGLSMAPAG
ncbi:MAG: helix-turn-helix transcriptional regulator [Alphaproteobacteria bacterium]|nr:helix-turn-helix transcriptional regulator [Alphaproteobacteria bacterium]